MFDRFKGGRNTSPQPGERGMPPEHVLKAALAIIAQAAKATGGDMLLMGIGKDPKEAEAILMLYGPKDRTRVDALLMMLDGFDRAHRAIDRGEVVPDPPPAGVAPAGQRMLRRAPKGHRE